MTADKASVRIPGLWPSVARLLGLRVMIFMNGIRRAKKGQKIRMAILIVALLAFIGFLAYLSMQFLRFIRRPELIEIGDQIAPLLQRVPELIFTATFFGILITSFGVLLQALYLAGDMDFLLARPIPIRAVFVAKMLQAIVPNFLLIGLVALPALFGYAAYAGYSAAFYPAAIVMMAALALAAAGFSALLVMAVVRFFPARRVAEVLGFLGAVLSFMCSQSGQLAQFSNLDAEQATGALLALERFGPAWAPLRWAAQGVTAIGNRDWLNGAGLTLPAVGLAIGIFAFTLSAAERLYFSGWARIDSAPRKKRPVATDPARASRGWAIPAAGFQRIGAFLAAPIPPAVRAVAAKDWLVLRRDLRNLSQIVTPLILGIVYAVMILGGSSEAPARDPAAPAMVAGALNTIVLYSGVGLSLFVSWMLLARLAGMGFAQEGKSYWMLKAAPVRSEELILAKFIVAYLPTLGLSAAYLLIYSLLQKAPPEVLIFSLGVIACAIAGNAGINLAFGIAGANLAWEDPRHMQRRAAGCLGSLVTMAYLPLILILFFGPAIALPLIGFSASTARAAGFVLGGAVSLACAVGPLWLVRERVARLGEA